MTGKRVAIIGTVGVPGKYGGFETLAENLVRHHAESGREEELSVYCSSRAYPDKHDAYLTADLRYVPIDANGVQSIAYDLWSILDAARRRTDVILILGVSGTLVIPLVRLLSDARIITNIDGIEWRRDKWNRLARWFLRLSEKVAVRWSHVVVADNKGIAEHVAEVYGSACAVVAYGGDHAMTTAPDDCDLGDLPATYALALCRIEPENNVGLILEAFSELPESPLVFVGNWENSDYGRDLRGRFSATGHLHLLDPVYDAAKLRCVRDRAWLYVHGHSAGGTNPSLVEMMHFSVPIIAYDCNFNRYTTDNEARYFQSCDDLRDLVTSLDDESARQIGTTMARIAQTHYTWAEIGSAYFRLIESL